MESEQSQRLQGTAELGLGARELLEPPRVEVAIASTDPAVGPDAAPVTIVEYSDYQ